MYISNSLLELIINRCTVEYNGTHTPWSKEYGNKGLYGRCAYWRVYAPGLGFICKITTPVKSINPKQKTLDKLFRIELRKRIEAIQETCEINHYGEVNISMRDPYSVRSLVNSIDGAYTEYYKNSNELGIKFFSATSKAIDKTLAVSNE